MKLQRNGSGKCFCSTGSSYKIHLEGDNCLFFFRDQSIFSVIKTFHTFLQICLSCGSLCLRSLYDSKAPA